MNINPDSNDNREPIIQSQIELNWQAYFHAFNKLHGDNPIEFEGRLLWQDGYMYSKSDYLGPEWPPPRNRKELLRLKSAYWTRRRKIVDDERIKLKAEIDQLLLTQRARSAPLQQTVTIPVENTEDGTTRYAYRNQDVDVKVLIERLNWLTEDVLLCDNQLRNIVTPIPPSNLPISKTGAG